MNSRMLISAENARLLDAEASADWALHPFALVEAAGRACADTFCAAFSRLFPGPPSRSAGGPFPRIAVLAGTGNNAADALVMLKALILRGFAAPGFSGIVVSRFPNGGDQSPRAESLRALKKMGVSAILWDGDAQEVAGRACEDMLALADIIIDGVTGTGLAGPLHGAALEMAGTVNRLKDGAHTPCPGLPRDDAGPPRSPAEFGQWSPALPPHPAGPPHPFEPPHPFRPLVVSIDVPSGNFDGWKTGMPILRADATLAIEPRKQCLYKPAARSFGGSLLPVEGIFPRQLIEKYGGPRLVDWEAAAAAIRPVDPGAHKYERGLVEIRAGSPGAAGAAKLAARGAQAAGAGLVRLIADPSIYPVLAAEAWGIMVVPGDASRHPEADNAAGRFRPDAVLLGPGWGTGPDRARLLENCLPLEEQGTPLILDADAITLAREMAFHGSAILTPHPGEFAAYTGISREEILSGPGPLLLDWARKKKAVILFKGPVLYIAAPDGRLGIVDGMAPCLATGGSGDILAGFCAALAARTRRQGYFDAYTCAAAAASLLIRAARSPELAGRFIDPVEITGPAASLAGAAWLPGYTASPTETGRHG